MYKLTSHICYETPKEGKEVVCVNGHLCCQKHHLERIRAIYQEGRNAFGYGGEGEEVEDASGQQCFMCRVFIEDDRFGESYFKCLRVIQFNELSKRIMGAHTKFNHKDFKKYEEMMDDAEK